MTGPLEKISGKTILVAPLDWGLGHATRCVPLIRKLAQGNVVIVGTTPVTRPVFDFYFPGLEQVELPSYNIRYSTRLPQWLFLAFRLPALLATIRKERSVIRGLVGKKKIDVVISDNRYGARHPGVQSYFVCHQLQIPVKIFQSPVNNLHTRFLKKFTALWIPDYDDRRLSGELSKAPAPLKCMFIGPLSALPDGEEVVPRRADILILLSGPEPQRTLLESLLIRKLKGTSLRVTLVRGTKKETVKDLPSQVTVYDFVAGALLRSLIAGANTVICRSGYSTLMDMHTLGKKNLVLIPTPGQPEQLYLAEHWQRSFGSKLVKQGDVEGFSFDA